MRDLDLVEACYNGPVKAGFMTLEESQMVFKKQFTPGSVEVSPFNSEKRKDYEGENGDDVLISVVVCPEEETHECTFVPSTFISPFGNTTKQNITRFAVSVI
ncbi:hypothetical protein RvY_11322-2 [Ramazzottius varieornatus]|uniref:Uncharacterized protein n=1 Tax=Ramazzottius varieornatus TaxID=947166 RepID=A0A1D1VHT1_RAMVA|nr:hypothetical protein RvY_11322-2 [Ramazzottius varieornatus]